MSLNGLPMLLGGGYLGLSEREWRLRPVTRTRAQWAEFVALWYAVHGSTLLERIRLWLVVWWLARRRRLQERCTIRLDPEAFGVKPKPYAESIGCPMPQINPRPTINWPCEKIDCITMGDLEPVFMPGRPLIPPADSGGTILR
jgi:hypothetical protein